MNHVSLTGTLPFQLPFHFGNCNKLFRTFPFSDSLAPYETQMPLNHSSILVLTHLHLILLALTLALIVLRPRPLRARRTRTRLSRTLTLLGLQTRRRRQARTLCWSSAGTRCSGLTWGRRERRSRRLLCTSRLLRSILLTFDDRNSRHLRQRLTPVARETDPDRPAA